MKPIRIAKDIIPISDLRPHAPELIQRLHRERRPLVLTQGGVAAAVLLAPADFDLLMASAFAGTDRAASEKDQSGIGARKDEKPAHRR
jgi:prevent-host-death family protein